jgi:Skp family chaperone for outer membrane proteins
MIMIKQMTGAALAGTLAIAVLTPAAQAQTGAAAPAIRFGSPIAGVCMFSQDELIGNSTVGKFVVNRLTQLGQQARSELAAQQTSLQNDAKALEAQKAGLSADQFNQRGAALGARERDFEHLVEVRNQEMQATQQKAFGRVFTEAQPMMQEAFQAHNCSLLLDGRSVLAVAPAMDITPQVVQGLNTKLTQFEFQREHLDQAAAAAPVGR